MKQTLDRKLPVDWRAHARFLQHALSSWWSKSPLSFSRAAPDLSAPRLSPCALRITAGVHRGAMLRLKEAARVGTAADNDLVLHDPDILAHHAEVRRIDGWWSVIDVSTGAVLAPFESRQSGRFIRERHIVGAAQFLITQPRPTPPTAPMMPVIARTSRTALVGGLLLIACACVAVVVVKVIDPASATVNPGPRRLIAEGWPDVELVGSRTEGLTVRGYVADERALRALDAYLRAKGLAPAQRTVRVGSELQQRIRDALADPDLMVDYTGGGVVRIQGTTRDEGAPERLRRLTSDLSGVVRIDNRATFIPARASGEKITLPFRISDVRPGEFGSFAGDNGSRYFLGALMPDGARVTGIYADHIEFTQNEKTINYPLN